MCSLLHTSLVLASVCLFRQDSSSELHVPGNGFKKKHKSLPSPPSHLQQPRKMLEETRVWLCMLCWHHTYVRHQPQPIASLCVCVCVCVCSSSSSSSSSSSREKNSIFTAYSSSHQALSAFARLIQSNTQINTMKSTYYTDRKDGSRDKPSAKHDQISSACNLSMGYHCYMLFVIPDVCCSILGLYSVERLRYSLVERFSPHCPCRAPV